MADNSTNLDPKKYEAAMKAAKQMGGDFKKMNKSLESQKGIMENISSTIFKISGSAWFTQKAKSMQDLATDYEKISEIDMKLKSAGDTLNKMFDGSGLSKSAKALEKVNVLRNKIISVDLAKAFDIPDNEKNRKEFQDLAKDIKVAAREGISTELAFSKLTGDLKNNKDLMYEMDKLYRSESVFHKMEKRYIEDKTGNLNFLNDIEDEYLKKKILEALQTDNISGLLSKQNIKAAMILYNSGKLTNEQKQQIELYIETEKHGNALKDILSKTTREIFDWKKGLKEFGINMAKGIIPRMLEFDNTIHEAQRTTGIMFTENSSAMTGLIVKSAQFGMNIKEITELMGTMSDVLNTTNFSLLSGAASDLMDIQMATGMSSESLGTMSAEMMRMGNSSQTVRDSLVDANVTAKLFGVNSKKALESISKNFVRFRSMGFQGGVESLQKMTAMSMRLGQNVDEIFNVADKARSIEGAIQVAAALQLAGGSFSNVNAMQLLSSSRKGPQEVEKMLTKMGSDIGHFAKNANEEMEYAFDPVDTERLRIVAEATEETVEGIQNRITKMAMDNKKLNLMPNITFEGLKDKEGHAIDPDSIKATLADAVNMTGQSLKGSVLDKAGINDLRNITQDQVKKIMQDQIEKDKNLAEQAKQNMGFEKSLTAFKDTLLNMLTIFQPVIDWLTGFFQEITSIINWIKKLPLGPTVLAIGALTSVLLLLIPPLIAGIGKMVFAFNPKNFGDIFKGGLKGAMSKKFGGGGENPLSKSLDGTTEMSKKTEGIKSGTGLKDFLTNLAGGLKEFANIKVFLGALSLAASIAVIGGGLWVLAKIFKDVDPLSLLEGALAIVGLAGALKLISMMEINTTGIVQVSIAMLLIGAAMIPFAYAAKMMNGIDWMSVLSGIAMLGLITIGAMALGEIMMTGIGALGLLAGLVALLAVAGTLVLVGYAFSEFGKSISTLVAVDWISFTGMGTSLLGLVGPLLAFSLAGLMFANPITMLGMMLMIGTLTALSVVLTPLAPMLDMASKSLGGMAEGVMKLSDSLQKLDFEKLDKLKEFSSEMASAASAGNIAENLAKLAEAIGKVGSGGNGGGGGAGTESRPIIIQLKMPNGREIERVIIHDLDKVS